jgi:hypothetical protein
MKKIFAVVALAVGMIVGLQALTAVTGQPEAKACRPGRTC